MTFEYPAAYILGVLSILSPCTIIVIPVFVSKILNERNKTKTAILFFLGFSSLFAFIGAITGVLGSVIIRQAEGPLLVFASIITFILSLKYFGLLDINVPNLPIHSYPKSSTFLLGVVFAILGFSCTAPQLFAVTTLALKTGSFFLSLVIFFCYSAGFATPLIAVATVLDEERVFQYITGNRERIELISGLLMLAVTVYLILSFFGVYVIN